MGFFHFKIVLAEKITALLPDIDPWEITGWMETPPQPEMGDLSLPCFQLSKQLKKSPQLIASELKDRLEAEIIERVEAVSG